MSNSVKLKRLCITAMLCAVAMVLVFCVRINVQFLTMDIKDAVLCVISLLFGPIYGLCSSAVVAFLEYITVSGTGVYGLIMNFISSASFTMVAGFVYYRRRNIKAATVGLVLAVVFMTVFMLLANLFITPFYMHTTQQAVIDLILPLLLPFNMLKGALNAALTLIIYKPVSSAVKRFTAAQGEKVEAQQTSYSYKNAIITAVSAIIICATVLILLLEFKGQLTLF